MELTYHKVGDYYLPNLEFHSKEGTLTKFGSLRKQYLKEHQRLTFDLLLVKGELMGHLLEIQEQANEMLDTLTRQLAKQQGVTEQLKAENPLEWVRQMNNLQHEAEEVVLNDLIYA